MEWFLRTSSSLHTRVQCRAVVCVNGSLNCGTGMSLYPELFVFVLTIPPARSRGRSGCFGYSECGTGLCDVLCFFLTSLVKVVALLRFSAFPSTHSLPAPLSSHTRWFSLTFLLSLTDRPPFFPFFLGIPYRLRSLAVQRCWGGF